MRLNQKGVTTQFKVDPAVLDPFHSSPNVFEHHVDVKHSYF